jgi:DnaK suppressor protein
MIVQGTKGEGSPTCELTPEELQEFRKLLIAKKRDLLRDLTGMTAEAKGAGPGDQPHAGPPQEQPKFADESDDREITIGLLASERVLLQEISEALDRIEKGTFGVCLATGEPIGKNRLMARPWAKYCISYARTMEQKNKAAAAGSRRQFDDDNYNQEGEGEVDTRDVRTIAGSDDDE